MSMLLSLNFVLKFNDSFGETFSLVNQRPTTFNDRLYGQNIVLSLHSLFFCKKNKKKTHFQRKFLALVVNKPN